MPQRREWLQYRIFILILRFDCFASAKLTCCSRPKLIDCLQEPRCPPSIVPEAPRPGSQGLKMCNVDVTSSILKYPSVTPRQPVPQNAPNFSPTNQASQSAQLGAFLLHEDDDNVVGSLLCFSTRTTLKTASYDRSFRRFSSLHHARTSLQHRSTHGLIYRRM